MRGQIRPTRLGLALAFALTAATSFAVDGTWINSSGGIWINPLNWAGGTVADGAGGTANFNTLDLTGATTVTLDSARTLGTLIFSDTDTNTAAGWILGNGGTAANTIAATNITVNPIFAENTESATNDVIISAIVTGTSFVKKGTGTLTLQGANTMGSLQIDAGLIAVGTATALGSGNKKVTYNGGGIRISTSGTIANTNEVLSTGHVYAPAANYDAFNGPWTGSGTMFIHASSSRFTPGGGVATALAGFTGTIDLADSQAGLVRLNLGSGTTYDLSAITLNTGTNAGRLAPRLTSGAQKTIRIGALKGGFNTQIHSSEQGASGSPTDIIWEVGALNTDTTFDGRYTAYNNDTVFRTGGLKKVGTGRLTLTRSGHTYNGATTISQGILALSNTASIASSPLIRIESGATFDVAGLTSAWTPAAAQTLGGSGVVTGAVAAIAGTIAPGASVGTLTFANSITYDGFSVLTNLFEITTTSSYDKIQVNGDLTFVPGSLTAIRVVPTGATIPPGTYELIKWTGTLTGDENNLALEYPAQSGTLALSVNNASKAIVLTVSGVAAAANLVWKGDGIANDWDFTTLNWLNGVTDSLFNNGDYATFNNVGSNNVAVNFAVSVNPASVTVNATKDYVFSSSVAAGIIGTGSLLKTNTGVLTVANENTYSGGTLIAGGVLQIGDGSNTSGSLGTGTVTNNATLVYNRPDNLTAPNLIVGSGSVVQAGAGILTVAGANTYAGGTTVSNGTLQLGGYTTLGTGPVSLAGGTFVIPQGGPTAGLSNVLNVINDATLQYNGANAYASVIFGPLNGVAGKTLTINHTSSGGEDRLRLYGNFTNDANVILNDAGIWVAPYASSGAQVFNGVLSGPGNLVNRAGGSITYLNGANTFSGALQLTTGTLGLGVDSTSSGGSVLTSPLGVSPLTLRNEGTSVGGNGAIFAAGGSRVIENPIQYFHTNAFTFIISGTNDLTLTGNLALHGQSDGFGGVNRVLQVNNTGKTVLSGVISDNSLACGLNKTGNGLLLLNGNNTYTGNTTVSDGSLGGSGILAGPVVVEAGGSLAPGASIGTLTINNDLTLNGNLDIEVNKSLAPGQSNDVIQVSGLLNGASGGTVTVTNLGPALSAGDRFVLFPGKTMTGGSSLTVTGAGMLWTNKLDLDGSIEVLGAAPTVNPNPTNITFSVSGGTLNLSWPASHTGWSLQAQTNSRSIGLSNNWTTLGYEGTNEASLTINPASPTVFFRLFYQQP
jgi:fibronectin-binding autotransporter adhesin